MAPKSGLAAQIGYKLETTWGTFVAPTRFIPLKSESITEQIDQLESDGILTGRRVLTSEQWGQGNVEVSGSIEHELYQQGCGLLFRIMFGAVSTTGAGPYVHTFTPGDLTDDHVSCQVGVPDVSGTVQPFSFYGTKVTEWELSGKVGEIVMLSLGVVSKQMATSDALASASFGSGAATPFRFVHATVSVAGSAAKVKEFSLKGNNGLDTDRRFLGTAYIDEPLEADLREYSGELTLEFESLTQMNRYRNATEAAVVITLSASASASLVITMNCRFDGSTPTVDGRGIVELKVPFKCVASSTDASAITAVMTNSDATPS